ncbi:hypothetical protein FC56_GL000301 [Lentilactobacillus senioris DSM 24302 = JCM 17472]|uniref:Uncharacterized protein n=1 Tax=Lentilactobacillus senioris DSM 24302 = JCM 17472 TaxID=1423802 RepID=A0A0R2D1W7_9LACO|nr:hypothetical protein FC56_GL000301 [Lentilactobacillus senioris DSM 24302 = JCM 17472]
MDSLPDTLNLGSCLNVADLTSILSGKTIKSISMSANLVGGSNTVLCRISPDTNYLQMKNLSLQAQVVTYAPMHYGKMAEIYYE